MGLAFHTTEKSPSRSPERRTSIHQPMIMRQPTAGSQDILQPKAHRCACGGGCPRCREQSPIQKKLAISEPGDLYEREADRIADQILAAPAHSAVHGTPPLIQTFTAQAAGQEQPAPASVDSALASPGRPLEPVLRQDMEQRFGYDFSRVRVHSGAAAEQSAREVNAHAYTVEHNVVFGAGRFAPGTNEGRRLLAHELTHVVQQSTPGSQVVQRQTGKTSSSGPSSAESDTVFTHGDPHGHEPSGRWSEVQKNPNSGVYENVVCSKFEPDRVMQIANDIMFDDKPIAREHLTWYLKDGRGADFSEDANLDKMLRTDKGIQKLLAAQIPAGASAEGKFAKNIRVIQWDYEVQDFLFAFGSIDRMDFEADFAGRMLHVWFQDRYEYHPVYPFYSQFPSDLGLDRPTNCVHAAAVELKAGTAADYWMKGEAFIPLSLVNLPAPAPTPDPASIEVTSPAPTTQEESSLIEDSGYTQCDFLDEHIDMQAQRALYQSYKQGGSARVDALNMLGAVKSRSLNGIYQEDRQEPVSLAYRNGTNWWKLVPDGQGATVYDAEHPPMMVYKTSYASTLEKLAEVISRAWNASVVENQEHTAPQPSGEVCPIIPPPKKEEPKEEKPQEEKPQEEKPKRRLENGRLPECHYDMVDWNAKFDRHHASCMLSTATHPCEFSIPLRLRTRLIKAMMKSFKIKLDDNCPDSEKVSMAQKTKDCVVNNAWDEYVSVDGCLLLPPIPPGKAIVKEKYDEWFKK